MIVPELEIPSGLEEAYFNLIAFLGGVNPDTIIEKRVSPARRTYSAVGARSLFVILEPYWDSLSSLQKNGWMLYWLTLPFGDHGGENGYPGSGYSAFVYYNAPLYAQGLPIELNAPVANFVFNGDFSLGEDGWDITTFPVGEAWIEDGYANFFLEGGTDPDAPRICGDGGHSFDLPIGNYRIEYDYITNNSGMFGVGLTYNFEMPQVFFAFTPEGVGHFSQDFFIESDVQGVNVLMMMHPAGIWNQEDYDVQITNISVMPL